MQCQWCDENMSLLEFLRKSNDQGAISGWLTRIWKAPGQPKGIEAFTNAYSMSGEEVVACVVMSGLNNLRFWWHTASWFDRQKALFVSCSMHQVSHGAHCALSSLLQDLHLSEWLFVDSTLLQTFPAFCLLLEHRAQASETDSLHFSKNETKI